MKRRGHRSPYTLGSLVWLALVAAFCLLGIRQFHWPWLIVALASVNLATFLLYGIDKAAAIFNWPRVPERLLWLVAFLGSPLGALGGMYMFHHKVSKGSFQFGLAVSLFCEIAIVLFVLDRLGVINLGLNF